jgi:hypothetical protein
MCKQNTFYFWYSRKRKQLNEFLLIPILDTQTDLEVNLLFTKGDTELFASCPDLSKVITYLNYLKLKKQKKQNK